MEGVLSEGHNKGQVGNNDGCGELESPRRDIIGNPEEGGDMNKEDIDVFEYVFIIRIQDHLKTPYGGEDVQGKGGKLAHGVSNGKQKNPARQEMIPAHGRNHFFTARFFLSNPL
jgi:hypothetical protein